MPHRFPLRIAGAATLSTEHEDAVLIDPVRVVVIRGGQKHSVRPVVRRREREGGTAPVPTGVPLGSCAIQARSMLLPLLGSGSVTVLVKATAAPSFARRSVAGVDDADVGEVDSLRDLAARRWRMSPSASRQAVHWPRPPLSRWSAATLAAAVRLRRTGATS